MDQRIGTILGNYRIVELLDRGAFGIVYRAEHVHLHTQAAIKCLHHAYFNSPKQREQFQREAQTLSRLKYDHVLRLLDFGFDQEGIPYLISEYAEGGSLRRRLSDMHPRLLPIRQALRVIGQVGFALQDVHSQGVIHRDLKPENILFDAADKALLADFGIAIVQQTASRTSVVGFGTPPYMAPEQFEEDGEPVPASDQYALACVTYELLTGRTPFNASNVAAYGYQHASKPPTPLCNLNAAIPSSIEQAVLTALAKRPEDRYPNVEAFLEALGIRRRVRTQVALDQGGTNSTVRRSYKQVTAASPTESKLPSEEDISTQLSPGQAVTQLRATTPAQPRTNATVIPPGARRRQSTQHIPQTVPPFSSAGGAPSASRSRWWEAFRQDFTTRSPFIIAKRLFLLVSLLDLLLLLTGVWLGASPFLQGGTVLAIGICICGLALTVFTEPWVWSILFLLLSPLAGGLYALLIPLVHLENGIVNWHTFSAYLLLTPAAGLLYGLLGPTQRSGQPMAAPLTRRLMVTIWFLGAGLLVGDAIGIPALVYLGLAWIVASDVLAVAQTIRLRPENWLAGLVVSLGMLGIPLLFWGFAYGVFGPDE